MLTVAEAKQLVVAEWRTWSKERDSYGSAEMQMFFGWVENHKPFFLSFRSHDDKWQVVHGWLQRDEDTQSKLRISARVK